MFTAILTIQMRAAGSFQVNVSLHSEFIFFNLSSFYYRLVIIKISPAAHMAIKNNCFIDVEPASNIQTGTMGFFIEINEIHDFQAHERFVL